jgi:hypothetical protein
MNFRAGGVADENQANFPDFYVNRSSKMIDISSLVAPRTRKNWLPAPRVGKFITGSSERRPRPGLCCLPIAAPNRPKQGLHKKIFHFSVGIGDNRKGFNHSQAERTAPHSPGVPVRSARINTYKMTYEEILKRWICAQNPPDAQGLIA